MSNSNDRIFPAEHYAVSRSNKIRKTNHWFCNKPLSPIGILTSPTNMHEQDLMNPEVPQNLKDLSDPEYRLSLNGSSENSSHGEERNMLSKYLFYNQPLSEMGLSPTRTTQQDSIKQEDLSNPEYRPSLNGSSENASYGEETNILSNDLFCNKTLSEMGLSPTRATQQDYLSEDSEDPEYYPSRSGSSANTSKSDNETKILSEQFEQSEPLPDITNKDNSLKQTKKNKNFCFFCETDVLNFARHIARNHSTEIEVQKILATPATSKERKELLTNLRKQGNFLNHQEQAKPVRKHTNTKYLPCSHCLGLYSKKNLWKHTKTCSKNINKKSGRSQVDAQNMLVQQLKVDPQLRELVFPRMRADKVSLVAKKDKLICSFGARYIKLHREKYFVPVASRKMRELAKILIFLQNVHAKITTLFHALKPENYDLLVEATKDVAKYDATTECYKAPTFAMNFGTTLKQCCEIALTHVLKRKSVYGTIVAAESEADIKTLIQLISAHWRFDVSSQASQDLNINKWNKVTLIPLASDLKVLKDYLLKIAHEAATALQRNNCDRVAYKKLLETVYCRVILLNRKRPGELQRFYLNTYETSCTNGENTYEEFSEAVSESEKVLMKFFKRIVIRGKRGRGVPVLFSKDVQENISLLLQHRKNIMKIPNLYLFGNPNTSEPIVGYKVLNKYVAASGAKNSKAITCTKLRKHLATLTQLFNMSETDMEQLATFMGHTLNVHRSSYRLPDDVYQTAKISKLLILMERGQAGQFKGKPLEEININLEENLMTDDETPTAEQPLSEDDGNQLIPEQHNDRNLDESIDIKDKKKTKKKPKRVVVPWTSEQKKLVNNFFGTHIKAKRHPKRLECEELRGLHPEIFAIIQQIFKIICLEK